MLGLVTIRTYSSGNWYFSDSFYIVFTWRQAIMVFVHLQQWAVCFVGLNINNSPIWHEPVCRHDCQWTRWPLIRRIRVPHQRTTPHLSKSWTCAVHHTDPYRRYTVILGYRAGPVAKSVGIPLSNRTWKIPSRKTSLTTGPIHGSVNPLALLRPRVIALALPY
jgi:hypothetical protein